MNETDYGYVRAVEWEGRFPVDAGAWSQTIQRILYCEGLPIKEYDQIPVGDNSLLPTPESWHRRFRRNRSRFYRRVWSANDAAHLLLNTGAVLHLGKVCLPLFASWTNPKDGHIAFPPPGEKRAPHTHAVRLISVEQKVDLSLNAGYKFRFLNTWGPGWGQSGTATISSDYFDKYVFDCWLFHTDTTLGSLYVKRIGHGQYRWSATDDRGRKVYGFEVLGPDGDRLAWTFAIETPQMLEVEELYVVRSSRRKGLGNWLVDRLAELSRVKGLPLRMWIGFSDMASESPDTVGALPHLAAKLGLRFLPSSVNQAAYCATTSLSGEAVPIEPLNPPSRPRSTYGELLLHSAIVGSAMALSAFRQADKEEHADDTTNSLVASGYNWDSLNDRRIELVFKKFQGDGLSPKEQEEYDTLQAIADDYLDQAYPLPLLTPEERERLKAIVQKQ